MPAFTDAGVMLMVKDLDKYKRDLAQADKATKGLGDTTKQTGKDTEQSGRNFGDFGRTLAIGAGVVATVAAAMAALSKAMEFGREGAVITQTGDSFEFLMQKVGAAPDTLDKLRAAARGTVDDMTLMSSTTTLLAGAQGQLATELAGATPQLLEIAKAANKLNPALGDTTFMYQSLALGIKRGSPLILDNLGLTIKIGEANEAMAKKLGKSVEALTAEEQKIALLNATMEAGSVLIAQAGGTTEAATDAFDALGVTIKNIADEMKTNLTPATKSVAEWFTELLHKAFLAKGEFTDYADAVEHTSLTYQEYVDQVIKAAIATDALTENQAEIARELLLSGKAAVYAGDGTNQYQLQIQETVKQLGVMTKAEWENLRAIEAASYRTEDAGIRMLDAGRAAVKYATSEELAAEKAKKLEQTQKDLEKAVESIKAKYEDFYGTLAEGIVDFRELGEAQAESQVEYEKKLDELQQEAKKVYGDVKLNFKDSLPDATTMQERMGMAADAWDEWGLRIQDIIANGVASPWYAALQQMGIAKPPDIGVKQWAEDLKAQFYKGELPQLINKQAQAWVENTGKMKQAQQDATQAYNEEVGKRKQAIQGEIDALKAARDAELAQQKEARNRALLELSVNLAEQTGLLQAWSQQKFGPNFSQVADSAKEVLALLDSGIITIDDSLAKIINDTSGGIKGALDLTGAAAEQNRQVIDSVFSGDWVAQQQQKFREAMNAKRWFPPEDLAQAQAAVQSVPQAIAQDPFAPANASWRQFSDDVMSSAGSMEGAVRTSFIGMDTIAQTTAWSIINMFTGNSVFPDLILGGQMMEASVGDSFSKVAARGITAGTTLKNVWINAVYPPIREGTRSWLDDLKDVQDEIGDIAEEFEKIPRNITVTITTTGTTGAQHGAQWTVQGQPGIDKVPVIFRATAGEVVTVTPAGQVPPPNPLVAPLPTLVPAGGGQGITVNFGDTTIANGMDLAAFEARVEMAVGRAVRGV